jgi:predicted dehydrogenase
VSEKVYRVGISGAGFGVNAHLPALLAHPRFEVVALASPSRAAQIAKDRNVPNAFASCAEMVAGIGLDAVVVASPPFQHRDDVLAALDAGKHVICEKPFALNIEQAEEMLAAAQDAGTACGIAHEFRFIPQRAAIKELVENGHLKPLRLIEMTHFDNYLRADVERPRGWWFDRNRGGGLCQARFSHQVDASNWIVGRAPQRVTGFLRTANPHRRDAEGPFLSTVDDGAFALLQYGDGLVAQLCADATSAVNSFTLAVHAENRTAVTSGRNVVDITLYTIDEDETNELQCKESPYARFENINGNVPLLMELYDEFVKQIETGTSALPTFEEGLETQRVLAAIGYTTAG